MTSEPGMTSEPSMTHAPKGNFIAVVGPSGAGKDSLIAHAKTMLAEDPRFDFPRRIITRPADETEACDSMTPEAFAAAQVRGAFALHWQAHGLHYGIPASIEAQLAAGTSIIANVSRSMIPQIREMYRDPVIILITADAEILAQRLQARQREAAEDQASRLQRSASVTLLEEPDIVIENNGTLDAARRAFVLAIEVMAIECSAARQTSMING
jgi:ribose 1,5-bisphosphokinase